MGFLKEPWVKLGNSVTADHPKEDARELELSKRSWLLGEAFRYRQESLRYYHFWDSIRGWSNAYGLHVQALKAWADKTRSALLLYALDLEEGYAEHPHDRSAQLRWQMKAHKTLNKRLRAAELLFENWQLSLKLRVKELGMKLPEWAKYQPVEYASRQAAAPL